LYFNL
jgi:hypothetical protein